MVNIINPKDTDKFRLIQECNRLDLELQIVRNKHSEATQALMKLEEGEFLYELAALYNKHKLCVMGSSDRDGVTELFLCREIPNGGFSASNVLNNMEW